LIYRLTDTIPAMAAGSAFDDLARDVPLSALESELEADRRRLTNMRERYEEIRADLEELNDTIRRRERLLEAYRGLDPAASPGSAESESALTKPEIAERVLYASVDPLYPRQVRAMAVERGWLGEDPAAHNQLAVAMSKMARQGRLVKGKDGRYSLPPRQ
jgi:hypothetical protein